MLFSQNRNSIKYNVLWIPTLCFATAGMTFFYCRFTQKGNLFAQNYYEPVHRQEFKPSK